MTVANTNAASTVLAFVAVRTADVMPEAFAQDTVKSCYAAATGEDSRYVLFNIGKGRKPWRAFVVEGTRAFPLDAEQIASRKAGIAACEYHWRTTLEVEAAHKAEQERIAAEKAVVVTESPEAAAAPQTDEPKAEEPFVAPTWRDLKSAMKKAGLDKNSCHTRKVVTPMFVLWRTDGDMYRLCTRLARATQAGEPMTYEDVAAWLKADKDADTDRKSGKGSLKSLERYLRECEVGSKLNPAGWELVTGREPKSKSWAGVSLVLQPRDGWAMPEHEGVQFPLTWTLRDRLEAFCQVTFDESLETFGRGCAEDFASDEGQTTDAYLAEHGNPADDITWSADAMRAHGFDD